MDFFNLCFNSMWLFYSIAFPFLMVLILGFLNSGNYGMEVNSYDYYGITMMIYIILNSSTIAANSFMEERLKKGNMRIIYSPLPKSFIYTSKILAAFIFSTLCNLIVIFFLYFFLNINFGGNNIGFVLIILLAFELFSSALGVLLCCIFKSESTTNQLLSIVINILALIGGLFFQLDGFGSVIEKLSYVSPVKWIVNTILQIIYDKNLSYFLPTTLILLVLSISTTLLCKVFYRMEDYI